MNKQKENFKTVHHDFRDFTVGDLVELKRNFGSDKHCSELGVVTGFSNIGWMIITWSNGAEGAWPFYKLNCLVSKQ
jgi:hypothetical protein